MAPRVYFGVRDALQLKRVPLLDLIESWRSLAEEVVAFLRNPENTEFILVTIPEALGVYQARRLVVEFTRCGLGIRNLIINNVIHQADCEFHRLRKNMQRGYIDLLVNEYEGRMALTQLPLLPYEVKGIERLSELETILFADELITSHQS
jgi:arsenite-transporting ATPase